MIHGGYSTYEMRVGAVQGVLSSGLPVGDVAKAYSTNRTTLFRWIKRYERQGETGLHRRAGSGRPRKLKEVDSQRFWNLVLQPATKFGYETDLWTVARVHQVVQRQVAGGRVEGHDMAKTSRSGTDIPETRTSVFRDGRQGTSGMVGTHAAQSTGNSAEIPGDSLFSGRSQCFVDGVSGQNMGTTRKDPQGPSYRKTGRSRRPFCDQQTGTSPVCLASEADCLGRGDSLPGSNAASSPQAPFSCFDG